MLQPSYMILYVDNPLNSSNFYSNLLGQKPVESSPTFCLFVLESGLKLGLWSKLTVEPTITASGTESELAIAVKDKDRVYNLFDEWKKEGLVIIQEVVEMNFGLNFVAADPDGHRLRVFAPNALVK